MSVLVIEACGPATSLQDSGRFGWQRYGLGPSGAMDADALAIANMLVGNAPGEAAIEFVMMGGRLRWEKAPARIALAGADMALAIDGRALPPLASAVLQPGETLTVGAARAGAFACLAVAGGFAVPPQLGSRSLHMRSGVGGRPLAAGDRLPLARDHLVGDDLALGVIPPPETGPIRVISGPQDGHFTPEGLATFLGSEYRVSPQADRMGYRLTGPKIAHALGFNIVSDGIATGAIQVPGSGEPIVLLADRQTTGGYPKIACIVSADLPRFARLRPGDAVRFAAVTREQAVAAARARVARIEAMRAGLARAGAVSLASERLLSLNLVGGVVSAG